MGEGKFDLGIYVSLELVKFKKKKEREREVDSAALPSIPNMWLEMAISVVQADTRFPDKLNIPKAQKYWQNYTKYPFKTFK